MSSKKIIFFILLSLGQMGYAQEDTLRSKVPFSVSYYGNTLVHKGFKLSADWILLEIKKTKIKKKGQKVVRKRIYTTPNIYYYKHVKSHDALQLGLDVLWRRSNHKGWFREVGSGYGYLRIYNVGDTYTVNADQNSVVNQKYASRGYFTVNSSFTTGRKIQLQNSSYLTPFLRLNTGFVMNYNSSFLLNTSLEFGVRFALGFNPKRGKYLIIEKTKDKQRK